MSDFESGVLVGIVFVLALMFWTVFTFTGGESVIKKKVEHCNALLIKDTQELCYAQIVFE
jgi:hypothetical protein